MTTDVLIVYLFYVFFAHFANLLMDSMIFQQSHVLGYRKVRLYISLLFFFVIKRSFQTFTQFFALSLLSGIIHEDKRLGAILLESNRLKVKSVLRWTTSPPKCKLVYNCFMIFCLMKKKKKTFQYFIKSRKYYLNHLF